MIPAKGAKRWKCPEYSRTTSQSTLKNASQVRDEVAFGGTIGLKEPILRFESQEVSYFAAGACAVAPAAGAVAGAAVTATPRLFSLVGIATKFLT